MIISAPAGLLSPDASRLMYLPLLFLQVASHKVRQVDRFFEQGAGLAS